MKLLPRVSFAVFVFGIAASAHACTVCASPNGQALRAGLFNGQFLHTLLLVMTPVPVLIAAVALLPFALPDIEPAGPVSGTLALLEFEAAG